MNTRCFLDLDTMKVIYDKVDDKSKPMFIEGVVTRESAAFWNAVSPETLKMIRDPTGYTGTGLALTYGVVRARLRRRKNWRGLFKHTRLPVALVKQCLGSDDLSYEVIATQDLTGDLATYAADLTDDHWALLCKHKTSHFTPEDVSLWRHRINWRYFSATQPITESLAETFAHKIFWHELRRNPNARLRRRFWKRWGYKIGLKK